ncbi:MAG: thioredoxin family protein [Crenarchaeota archaeon]|nr:thioredoxin family protein [Thermoproteota archaeon]
MSIEKPEKPDGLYLYENGAWIQKSQEDFTEGVHIVYFNNKECFACLLFNATWNKFVELTNSSNLKFWTVICSWFAKKCSDDRAKWLFENYQVKSSPTILIIRDGVIVKTIKGSLSLEELEKQIKDVLEGKEEQKEDLTKRFVC